MGYTYGMQGTPAVGKGAPGLPVRAAIGEIRSFNSNPGGDWLPCNGEVYKTSDYPILQPICTSQLTPLQTKTVVGSVLPNYTSADGLGRVSRYPGSNRLVFFKSYGYNGYSAVTENYGATWSYVYTGMSFSTSTETADIDCSTSGTWIIIGSEAKAGRSTSDASSWSTLTALQTLASGTGLQCVRTNDLGVWLVSNSVGTVYRSTDDGVSWTSVSTGLSNATNLVGDDAGNWVAASGTSTIAVSTNNGANWSTKTIGGAVDSVRHINGIFIAENRTNNTKYISFDSGATWSLSGSSNTLGSLIPRWWRAKDGIHTPASYISSPSNLIPASSADGGLSVLNTVQPWSSSPVTVLGYGADGNLYYVQSNNTNIVLWRAGRGSPDVFTVPAIGGNYYIKAR